MKIKPVVGEYYHVYNRGANKSSVFLCDEDMERFLTYMSDFNTEKPTGGLRELKRKTKGFRGPISADDQKIVDLVAYSISHNHYHLVVKQISENGVSRFMQRVGLGYTMYFNEKYKHDGVIFQGKYKKKHICSNDYLLHVVSYVNLNFKVHNYRDPISAKYRSSWVEYTEQKSRKIVCDKGVVLSQFKTRDDYKKFAKKSVEKTLKIRESDRKNNIVSVLIE